MRYQPIKDGEWVTPVMRGYRVKCCDCGLVHVWDFKITRAQRRNTLSFRVRRK